MSRKYKFRDQRQTYFVHFVTVHWIDVFTRSIYCDRVVDSIKYCQNEKGLIVYAWCIIPSHIHMIIETKHQPMQNMLETLKALLRKKSNKR